MGPRGRGRGGGRGGRGGNFRGRGGRGRGRGRGRGAARGGPARLDMNRIGDNASSGDDVSMEGPMSDQDEELDGSSGSEDEDEDEDEQEAQKSRPYLALLQGFTESSGRDAKRRKLDNGTAALERPPTTQPEPEQLNADESDDEGSGEGEGEEGKDVDLVEEPEEDPAQELLDGEASDDEDQEDASDPFDSHFTTPDESLTTKRADSIAKGDWATVRSMSKVSKAVVMRPNVGEGTHTPLPSPVSSPQSLKLKQKLRDAVSRKMPSFDDLQQGIGPIMFNYMDILYGERSVRNASQFRQLVCLHAINHVLKTRDRVIKNNAKLSKDENSELELRDQGFTRPKVLFLLPTRQSCANMVSTIEDLVEPDQRENRKRFEDAYVQQTEEKFRDQKEPDFLDLFGGNDDDMFRLGVKFTRKTIKYFAQFYNSDILMASPLGLRMAMGSSEENKGSKNVVDHDFLSSIEMVVVDQADGLLMQNWSHVEYIFEHLNLQPRDSHGCDFSRVRPWYLDGRSRYFRQTIVLSPFVTPELSELFRTHCLNWAGKVRFQPDQAGVLQQLPAKVRQTFSRFEPGAVDKDPDARFAYFTSAVIPSLAKRARDRDPSAGGTLVFVPSYLDFVRLRNYFATNDSVEALSFGTLSEYSDATEAARARSHFLSGRHKVLLYTERAHHFRRYRIRGVRRVVMYGLPENPVFYREIAGDYIARSEQDTKVQLGPGQGVVRAMFSKYDVMKLERVVGTPRVGKMVRERGDTFDFV